MRRQRVQRLARFRPQEWRTRAENIGIKFFVPRLRQVARPLVAALVLSTALIAAAPRVGAQYGGNQGFLIDPPIAEQGERVNFLGVACGANTEIVFIIRELGLIIARTVTSADGDGAFFVSNVLVPDDLPPGLYTIEARCMTTPGGPLPTTPGLTPFVGYVPDPRMPVATLLVLGKSVNQCVAATNASIKAAGQQNVTTTSIYCPTTGVGAGAGPRLAITGNRPPALWVRSGAALIMTGAFLALFGGRRRRRDRPHGGALE